VVPRIPILTNTNIRWIVVEVVLKNLNCPYAGIPKRSMVRSAGSATGKVIKT